MYIRATIVIDSHRAYFYDSLYSEHMWIAIRPVLSVPPSCTFYCFINTLSGNRICSARQIYLYVRVYISARVDASLYKHDPCCSVDPDRILREEDRVRERYLGQQADVLEPVLPKNVNISGQCDYL